MRKTFDAARGKWKGILLQLEFSAKNLSGKHGSCPMCGGDDRFRWDNKDGNGTYICNQCGAGNGMQLVMAVKGWDFKTAANTIDKICGNVKIEKYNPAITPERRTSLLNDLWMRSKPLADGDMAFHYLSTRQIVPLGLNDLRYCDRCRAPDGNYYAAMIAMVRDEEGEPVNLHRTFLENGGKASCDAPRALMPGRTPEGSCVRLGAMQSHIGVAEGIETALRASDRFGLPVWAAINSTLMAKWQAPQGVKAVTVFGDNDPKFGGAAAAYTLAHKLAVKGLRVDVRIPEVIGKDWADAA